MPEQEVGKITHYFTNISVATIKITEDTLKIGDTLHIKGNTTDFTQTVESMRIEKDPVEEAKKGDTIGTKVNDRVRDGDVVFKVTE